MVPVYPVIVPLLNLKSDEFWAKRGREKAVRNTAAIRHSRIAWQFLMPQSFIKNCTIAVKRTFFM
jgi:hypothetical protein